MYDALLDGIEWNEYGPGNDRAASTAAFNSVSSFQQRTGGWLDQGQCRAWLDADGLTFACAMGVEAIARRLGRTAVVGLGVARCPQGRWCPSARRRARSRSPGRDGDHTRVVDSPVRCCGKVRRSARLGTHGNDPGASRIVDDRRNVRACTSRPGGGRRQGVDRSRAAADRRVSARGQ
jgi:hypothetical protein